MFGHELAKLEPGTVSEKALCRRPVNTRSSRAVGGDGALCALRLRPLPCPWLQRPALHLFSSIKKTKQHKIHAAMPTQPAAGLCKAGGRLQAGAAAAAAARTSGSWCLAE